jgi:hypothetical protein
MTVQDIGTKAITLYRNWTITVNNSNRAPHIDILEPLVSDPSIREGEVQNFLISVYDPDTDDDLFITWFVNDEPVLEDEESFSREWDYESAGRYNITVEVWDGYTTASKSWELRVRNYDPNKNRLFGRTYDEWGIIIEVIILAVTAVIALVGVFQYRKKRSHLKGYMREIKIINEFKQDLDEREKALVDLRDEVVKKYKKGDMDDNHFLIIEKKLEDSIRKTREAQIEEDLDVELSLDLRRELDDILADGVISDSEFSTLRLTILNEASLTPEEKRDMLKMVQAWRKEDKPLEKKPPAVDGKAKK